jgi:hypothetical protein
MVSVHNQPRLIHKLTFPNTHLCSYSCLHDHHRLYVFLPSPPRPSSRSTLSEPPLGLYPIWRRNAQLLPLMCTLISLLKHYCPLTRFRFIQRPVPIAGYLQVWCPVKAWLHQDCVVPGHNDRGYLVAVVSFSAKQRDATVIEDQRNRDNPAPVGAPRCIRSRLATLGCLVSLKEGLPGPQPAGAASALQVNAANQRGAGRGC